MIELVFVLIIIEVVVCVWLIQKFNLITHSLACLNETIKESPFKGNLTETRLMISLLNKKIKHSHENTEKPNMVSVIQKVINGIVLGMSVFNWFKKLNKNKTKKKYKTL